MRFVFYVFVMLILMLLASDQAPYNYDHNGEIIIKHRLGFLD